MLETLRDLTRWLLAAFLVLAGTAHLSFGRDAFDAQVPDWLPLDTGFVVVSSGVVEIALGVALLVVRRHRVLLGWVLAAFFVAVFPGNVSQYVTGSDAFGLDTDRARLVRLFFQPLLVAWALWACGSIGARRGATSSPAVGHAGHLNRRHPTPGAPMIVITARFQIKPEHADAWPEISRSFTEATRAEAGNLWFDWSRSLDDPTEYVLLEAFQDDAAEAHVTSAHFKAAQDELPQYLTATPRIINATVPGTEWSELGEMQVD